MWQIIVAQYTSNNLYNQNNHNYQSIKINPDININLNYTLTLGSKVINSEDDWVQSEMIINGIKRNPMT